MECIPLPPSFAILPYFLKTMNLRTIHSHRVRQRECNASRRLRATCFFSILFGVHYTALFTTSAFTLHNYWRIPKRCSDAVTAPIQEKYSHIQHAYAQFEWEKLLQSKNSDNEKYTRYFCFCQVFPSCHSLHIFLACLWLLEIEVKKIILKRSVKSTLDHFKKSGAQLESVNCNFISTWAHHKAVHLLVANCNRHHDDQFKLTADTTPHITSIDST